MTDPEQIAADWAARGFSCDLWTDPPGERWEAFDMNRSHAITLILSLVVASGVGFATAIATAIVLAIVDVYLSGHGLPTLSQAWIDTGPFHLSRADAVMLALATLAGIAAGIGFYFLRRTRF